MKPAQLPDHNFFEQVARAAFSNPFSDERLEADIQLSGQSNTASADDRVKAVRQRISAKIEELEARGLTNAAHYSENDRHLLRTLFLFHLFHQFMDDFDRLILEQIQAGDTPTPVRFADDALSQLTRRGLVISEALQYFALFFQLRRAYYLIDNNLIGQGPAMENLRRRLWNNIFTHDSRWYERYLWNRMEDFSTLLLGETGTGKGMAAAAIGRSCFIPFDTRRGCFKESFTRNFISINLSQFSDTLIQSELFGHKKGAFTGAIDNHDGLFARCSPHGAVFLDEIGEVSTPTQIMLLKILQERTFSPVGSHEQRRFNGRVIAATNRPIAQLRSGSHTPAGNGSGLFRDDFFYRLCSDIIEVPPLRQRLQENPQELTLLVKHIVGRIIGEPSPRLAEMAQQILQRDVGKDYNWPGNVREMEQAIRRIVLTKQYQIDLPQAEKRQQKLIAALETGNLTAEELLSAYCRLLYERFGTYEEVARRTNLDRRTVKKYTEV